MSIYNKATLVQIPSGYKASGAKLYSVLPADGDGDFTVSADADATRIDENGLIESTVANQARLSRNFIDGVVQPDPFLLLEPTRRNLFINSEDFSNSSWIKTRGTVTPNQATAPDGSNNADLLTGDGTGTTYVYDGVFLYTATYYISIFVKNINGNDFTIQNFTQSGTAVFDLVNKSVTSTSGTMSDAKIEQYPNNWFRVSAKITSTLGGANCNLGYGVKDYNGDQFYMWGAQVEDNASGGSVSNVLSYIPTTSAAVTRTVDSCKKLNFADMPTDYPFTAFWQGKIDDYDSSGFTSQVPFSLAATGTFNCFFALNFYSTTQLTLRRRNDSDNSVFVSFTSDKDTTYKIAVCFISATAAKIYINGTEVLDSTSLTSVPYIGTNTPDSVFIAQLRDSSDTGKRNSCEQFMLFNKELSDSELIQITS